MIRFDRLLALPLVLLAFGCAPKQVGALATTSGDLAAGAEDGAGLDGHGPITQAELDTLQANFLRVQFEFDKADLDAPSRDVLQANAEILMRHRDVRVRVEGHADHYGEDIYNLALGQRRADSVRRYLVDLGVQQAQLDTISFGEERPLVADGTTESEAVNRRAEFFVIVGGQTVRSSY